MQHRITGIVSRGGALHAQWMVHHKKQNPLVRALRQASWRSRASTTSRCRWATACVRAAWPDACDAAQFAELKTLGELTRKAWEKDVQVMVEGPGPRAVRPDRDERRAADRGVQRGAVLRAGPARHRHRPGYDHITSAIGATMAGYAGAAMLCYVTPKEHLGLPDAEDVKQGVIAYKIAAHAADVARHRKGARDRDDALSRAALRLRLERAVPAVRSTRRRRARMHDETLPAEGYKTARLLQHVRARSSAR